MHARPLSSSAQPPSLSRLLAGGRMAVFLDFDGTIVDLAAKPDAIVIAPRLAERLVALSERLDGALAVVSGRSVEDLQHFLGPSPLHLAGSHGADVRSPSGVRLSLPGAIPNEAADALAAFAAASGLHFEPKTHGAALHYRGAPEREADARRFADELAAAHGLAVKAGKCVVELVAPGADKGSAVALLADRPPFTGACPVFIGDDITDEDGFAACAQRGGFGIAVGERPASGARYRLGAVSDVFTWLAL